MNIGPKTIEKATEMLGGMLRIYQEDIDKAFLRADNALTVALGLKFKSGERRGEVEIETAIKFVTDQVKDSVAILFNENQGELFTEKDGKEKGEK